MSPLRRPTEPLTKENAFLQETYQPTPLPIYAASRHLLPQPVLGEHPLWLRMHDWVWELTFKNFRQPEAKSGFHSNFIDPAFNENTFMWDSAFMTMFGCYGHRAFPAIHSLDNFYAKQHEDGYICREINTYTGQDFWERFDPDGTGPAILAWAEWLHYLNYGDRERLKRVFPPLMAYHRWYHDFRTWPDGLYWATGLSSGMDNQSRVPDSARHHRHYTWVDTNMQAALDCPCLQRIAEEVGRSEFVPELSQEFTHMCRAINERLWDEETAFYYDAAPDGRLSPVKSIGAYWGLLAEVIPPEREVRFIAHLSDERTFNRPHRIPAQAADSRGYDPSGGYWLGGVWPPTNYMVLKGLRARGYHDLAREIAWNHLQNIGQVFAETGTVWENYAPEKVAPGRPARRDFVGWGGLGPIAVLIEDVIGIQGQRHEGLIFWDLYLTEEHGVQRYPFGLEGTVNLVADARPNPDTPPKINVETDVPFELCVRWQGKEYVKWMTPGKQTMAL